MNGRTILTLGSAALVASACGTTRLNAGSNGDGGASDAAPQGLPYRGTPSNSYDMKCDLPVPDWLAGAWQGEFDAFALPSGSKAVRIEFTGSRNTFNSAPVPERAPNSVCGTVTLGDGAPPPVATDPKAPPPGGNGSPQAAITEGFAYGFSTDGAILSDGATPRLSPDQHLSFAITLNQIYKSWCNLQLSYAQFEQPKLGASAPPRNSYLCLPPNTVTFGWTGRYCDSGISIEWDSCAQAFYCFLGVCDCDEWGCSVSITHAPHSEFVLSVAGGILSGNVVLSEGVEGLHLTRAP